MRNRSWVPRRIVYTKKVIAFANLNDDEVLDVVPMHEIDVVRDLSILGEIADDESQYNAESVENGETSTSAENDDGNAKNVMQIETSPEGYNSGRYGLPY